MKRTFMLILAAVAGVVLFGWLVHLVLVAANLTEPAPTTVYGMTPRRVWATAVAVLGLAAVAVSGLALRQSARRMGSSNAVVALAAGLIAAVNGGLNLAIAKGGPGSGNGV